MSSNNTSPRNDRHAHTGPEAAGRRTGRGGWIAAAVAGVIAVSTLGACSHHRGGWHGADADPAQRIEHMVDHVFSRVDATDEQKSQITSIATGAFKDLAPLRGKMRGARTQALNLLTADPVDADAVQALRADQVALLDQASSRAAVALTEIAQVLTPEQRLQVREKMAERLEKRRGWKRWYHGS